MPAQRLFVAAGVVTLILAVAAAAPWLAWVALTLDVLLLFAFAIDLRRAAALPLSATREWPALLVQGASAPLRVLLVAPRGARLQLRDALSPGLAEAPQRASFEIAEGGCVAWRYVLTPRRRGTHRVGSLCARVLGPWGLGWSQRELLPDEQRRVYPQVRWEGEVGRLLMLADRRQLGQTPLRTRGVGSEPYALREHRPGDALTHINWKASVRHARLLTREDTWERGARLVIALDCARAMSAVDAGRSKLDHALAAALALVRVAAARGDRVALVAFSDRIERSLRVRSSAGGVSATYAALFDLEPRLAEPAYDLAVEHVSSLETRRATVVLLTSVSDLVAAESLQEALARLRRRHQPVLVNLEDPEIAQLALGVPVDAPEAFAKLAALEILLGNRRLGSRLQRSGIRVATTSADQLAWRSLEAYLAATGNARVAPTVPSRGPAHGASPLVRVD